MAPALLEHQVEGVEWLRRTPHALLADEPGLGKSGQALLAAEEPILVVAPAMVLDSGTWDDETTKWLSSADVTQVAYSGLTERERTKKGGTRPTGVPREEFRREWGTVIADEAHYLKGRDTHWTQGVKKLRTRRMTQLTGTPIPNWAHEAFVPLQLAHPEEAGRGERLGSYWRWVKEWFDVGPTLWSPMEVGDLRADRTWDEFREVNWGDRTLRRLRDDCLDLPPLTMQQWRVRMGAAQKKAYRELERDFVTWLDSGLEVEAWNTAAQVVKLAKCATGLEVLDPGTKGSAKLDALRDLLKDRPLPTLVVGHFRPSVAACAAVAGDLGLEVRVVDGGTSRADRKSAIRAFQSGELPVLCATIDTISEGMTLTAADQIVRVERSWRPSRNDQVVRRLHRIGQQRPVIVVDLVTDGTVDDRVLRLLEAKTDQQMKALGKRGLRELAAR